MQIEIDGRVLDVPEAYVHQLAQEMWARFETIYAEKTPDYAKAGADLFIKGLLLKEETTARMKYGKEAARAYRVPAKENPTLWLAQRFMPVLEKSLKDATLTCETRGDTITNFAVQLADTGQTGGQVDIAGSERLRENNGLKVS